MESAHRLNVSAGIASVGSALFLVCLKIWALVATGSLSVAASLADSALDLLAASGGLAGILYAAKPPDEDHSFGHTSAEDLVALAQALLVAGSAVLIGWNAVHRLGAPPPLAQEGVGLVVMAISIAVTIALVTWQGHVARRTGSRIVAADRMHYLSDLLPSLGAIAALLASSWFGVHWLDPVIALAACAVLVLGASHIGVGAWHSLMDHVARPEQVREIERIVATYPGVRGFHDLRTRTSGSRIFVQVHLELDGSQSLNAAHAIGAGVRRALLDALPNSDVIIHQDPV
jgi:ferrous-iron efflux pump FieF